MITRHAVCESELAEAVKGCEDVRKALVNLWINARNNPEEYSAGSQVWLELDRIYRMCDIDKRESSRRHLDMDARTEIMRRLPR